MKTEQCDIRLTEKDAPQVVLSQSPPTSARFVLVPKHKPELSQQICGVVWHATKKQLEITAHETANLAIIEWMDYIHQRQKQINEGPFVDLNQDALTLQLVDPVGQELGRVMFKILTLNDHECVFDRSSLETVTHRMVIGYQEYKQIPRKSSVPDDEEWRTIEA